MGNIERRVERKRTFCHLKVLDRYIFDESSLVVQAIAQCFQCFLLQNKPFYLNNANIAGRIDLKGFIFLICGHLKKNAMKKLQMFICTNKTKNNSKMTIFI